MSDSSKSSDDEETIVVEPLATVDATGRRIVETGPDAGYCGVHIAAPRDTGDKWPTVATAEANEMEDGVWLVARVLVSREGARCKGLGSEVLQRMLARLSAAGATAVLVGPGGYGSNLERLEKFYQKNGFVKASNGVLVYRPGTDNDDVP